MAVQDITFKWNVLRNVAGVFQMMIRDDYASTQPLKNILIENNLAISAGTENGNQGRVNMMSRGGGNGARIS